MHVENRHIHRTAVFAVVLIAIGLFGPGCGDDHAGPEDHDSHAGHGSDAEEGGHEEQGGSVVTLSKEQIALAELKTQPAAFGAFDIELLLTGDVTLNQNRRAHVVPRVSGVVREVNKLLGDRVRAGEQMAVLESGELGEAKTEYLKREQEHELAQADLDRVRTIHDNTLKMLEFLATSPSLNDLRKLESLDLGENRAVLVSSYSEAQAARALFEREKTLHEKMISSGSEFLEAESGHRQAEAVFAAAQDEIRFAVRRSMMERGRSVRVAEMSLRSTERALRLLGLELTDILALPKKTDADEHLSRYIVHAPFDGTIIEKHIVRGELVNEETDLYEICDLQSVWIIARVYEEDIPRVKKGQRTQITLKAHADRRWDGQVTWIADTVDEDTRTLKIRVEVDNADRVLKAGMFATIALAVESRKNVLTIPPSALQTQRGETIVFVARGDGRFERREVEVGARSRTAVVVLAGLEEGDLVVTGGSFILRSELEKEGFEAGHAH